MVNPNNIGYIIIETATTSDNVPEGRIIRTHRNRLLAEGVLQEANMTNRNTRWYDDKELFPQITCPRTQELLRTGNMRGENGHPLDKDLTRQQTIDPNNCVVIFTKFWTEGNFVKGQFFGTFNEKGEEFNADLAAGFLPSFSLRALGSIVNTARGAEVKNIKLITYDRVIYPSHDKAYTTGLVSESAALAANSNLVLKENDHGLLIPIDNQSALNYIKEESSRIKRIKESFEFDNDVVMEFMNGYSQIKISDTTGQAMVVNLEDYIHHELMNTCTR